MIYINGLKLVLAEEQYMNELHEIYLSIGSNMGNRMEYLRFGINELENELNLIAISSIYETEPWGYSDDKPYLNLVARFNTRLNVHELMKICQKIEQNAGRILKEKPLESDYQARTLDIDVLFYDQQIIQETTLEIPHPRLHLRNFVLVPFAEINGSFVHPVLKKTIDELNHSSSDKSEIKNFERTL